MSNGQYCREFIIVNLWLSYMRHWLYEITIEKHKVPNTLMQHLFYKGPIYNALKYNITTVYTSLGHGDRVICRLLFKKTYSMQI